MAGSTTKKAVIRRFEKETLSGYVNPLSFLKLTGIELLSEQGNVATVPYDEVKTVTFVRDFDDSPETARRVFQTRPKMEGLWVRLEFRDSDVMEGILANNLMQLEPFGFSVTPPDPYSNQQRIFIPLVGGPLFAIGDDVDIRFRAQVVEFDFLRAV